MKHIGKEGAIVSVLTRPLSTMSLCRSLEDSTRALMACISSVQEARILQGATEFVKVEPS